MKRTFTTLATLILTLAACADPTAGPPRHPEGAVTDAVKIWEDGAAVHWNGVGRELVMKYRNNPFQVFRAFALLSVAQYHAAIVAEQSNDRNGHPSVRAAVSAASATALTFAFPVEAAALQSQLAAYLASPSWPGEQNSDVAAGAAIGQVIGQQLIARAMTDRFFAPWTGTVPVGPGLWFSSTTPPTPPVGGQIGAARTYLLLSGSQFRPPPPPAFGSAAFLADLAEVRQISDTRTAEQDQIAKFWDFPVGTVTPPGYWNEQAALLAVQYHLNERAAAHLFALMNMAGYDAIVASHDAKFTYWLIRPSQADPAITLAIGLPNFPSYPSNHAAISAAMSTILGATFPAESARLDALAEEAALSRVYGGIHYRFDATAGLTLGRNVAAWALAHDVNGHEPFVLR
jgi:membrane-associated phospholipid phosphatase